MSSLSRLFALITHVEAALGPGTLASCDTHYLKVSRLVVRGDADFDDARLDQYASMLGTKADAKTRLNPAMVAYCDEEAHVQSAVQYAQNCGFKVVVRSGGHSYTGSSSCNFNNCLQLDLTGMTKLSVHGNMITTEPGLRLLEFAEETLKHFLSVPHGGCSTVGIGGHFQSSAWGFMASSFGSGLDRVESFRMVLANGTVGQFSRTDTNSTVYKSVLGSAPGSWGIITQYTMSGVHDREAPHTRVLGVRIPFSRDNFLTSWRQCQFVTQDQEKRNLRDLKLICIVSPPTEGPDEGSDTEVYITVVILWTGVDSGRMTKKWHNLYMQPFLDLEHLPFPNNYNYELPLSVATRMMANLYTNHNDSYAVQAFHSDYWWDDEFNEMIADELVERVALIPDIYPSFQYLPLGQQTQWARNAGMNALTWRDTRAYVDDWMFVKNQSRYQEAVTRMRNFRERTRHKWQHSDGGDHWTWMSPITTYANSTDLRDPDTAKKYFPNTTQFHQLQALKVELDPNDLFSNVGTIPHPKDMRVLV